MKELLNELLTSVLTEAPKKITASKNTAATDAKKQPSQAKKTPATQGKKSPAQQAKDSGYKSIGSSGYWSKTGEKPAEATTRGGVFKVLNAKEKEAANKELGADVKAASGTVATRAGTPSNISSPTYAQGKSAASDGLVGKATKHPAAKDESGKPLEIRYVVDEKGNPVNTSTPEGRKTATRLIDTQLKKMSAATKQACQDFKSNINAQKWLGEIGELYALKEILEAGKEAYLMSDSNPESDIAILGANGDKKKDLTVIQISVKSSTKEEVGQQGANARAVILKMVEGKRSTFDKKLGEVSAESAIDSIYDIREMLGYYITQDTVSGKSGSKKELELSKEQLARCTPEYQAAYKENRVINGVPARKNFSLFERSRLVTTDDLDSFEGIMLSAIEKKYANEPPEKIDEQKKLAQHFLNKIKKDVKSNPDYTMRELQEFIVGNMGTVCDGTTPPTDVVIQSDLVSLQFNAETGVPKVGVAKADDVKNCVESKLKSGSTAGATDSRMGWSEQFYRFVKPVWKIQARMKASGRGGLQFKLNWAPEKNCTKQNSKSVADYLRTG